MSNLKMVRRRRSGDVWQVMLMDGNERVAGLNLHIMKMRVGSVPVHMAGIGGVGTHEKHRKKGYASRVMWDAIEFMDKKDWEFSLLFGIPDFYHRFGYGVVFPDSELSVKTENLGSAGRPMRVRAMKQSDLPAVRRLYKALSDDRSGSAARPSSWDGFVRAAHYTRPGKTVVSTDARGRATGYASWNIDEHRKRFNVSEIVGHGPDAHASLSTAMARQAARLGHEEVRIFVPPDDPYGQFCSRFGCSWDVRYPRSGGAMGRIIQLDRLFQKLEPELQRRWAQGQAVFSGLLAMETDTGTVGIRLQGRKLTLTSRVTPRAARVKLSQLRLTQLIMGYRSIDDLALEKDVTTPIALLPVLDTIFPRKQGYMWWSDRF